MRVLSTQLISYFRRMAITIVLCLIAILSYSQAIVSINATDMEAFEANVETGTFTISRTEDLVGDLTVDFMFDGSATEGEDYLELPRTVIIHNGEESVELTMTPIDDDLPEEIEKVHLTILASENYILDKRDTDIVTIVDNDQVEIPNTATRILIGTPTNNSVVVNVIPNHTGEFYFEYGTSSGVYSQQTAAIKISDIIICVS